MTLGQFMSKPLNDQIADMELVEMKPHTNDAGEIQCVELKYVPRDGVERKKVYREEKNQQRRY